MKEPIFPGDSFLDLNLTKKLQNLIDEQKATSNHLDFISAFPTISSERWYMPIPDMVNEMSDTSEPRILECVNYAFSTPIDIRHYANHIRNKHDENIEESIVRSVISENVIDRHKRSFYEKFLVPNSFDRFSPENEWEIDCVDDSSNFRSNPLNDIKNWKEKIYKNTNVMPNRAVMSSDIYKFLIDHKTIKKSIVNNTNQYQKHINIKKIISELLELEKIYTIDWLYNEKKEKFNDCNSFLLYYAPDKLETYDGELRDSKSAMAKIIWSNLKGADNEFNTRILKWEDPSRRSFVLSTDIVFGFEVLSKKLGGIYRPKRRNYDE